MFTATRQLYRAELAARRMTQTPPIVLRYFDARGRAQFLRYFLRARGIPYTDDRVPLSADFAPWAAIRNDRSIVGPFHKLPVLRWGERMIAETLVIQSFLHRALGDEAALSEQDNLRHAMLVSSLYNDVMLPVGILLWAEVMFAGADMKAVATRTAERLRMHLLALERTLEEWHWLERGRERPVLTGDCLLWEELSVLQHVFGKHAGLEAAPGLARFHREFAAREICEQVLGAEPCPVTARPGELEAIVEIQALLG
jgi:hypothetical protein